MRTKEELNSPQFNDDMSELEAELKARGVEYTIKKHAGALEGGGKVKEIIGFYPAGEWHIHVGEVSIIRGMASWGEYEAYGGKYKPDPERFHTAKELVDNLLDKLKE